MTSQKLFKLTSILAVSAFLGGTAVATTANAATKNKPLGVIKVVKIANYAKTRYTVKKSAKPVRVYTN